MNNSNETDQLRLWRGEFGRHYIERNAPDEKTLTSLERMWKRMLQLAVPPPARILEVGCNIGLNLRALRRFTHTELFAVEPNATARERVIADKVLPADHIYDGSAARSALGDGAVDLAFTMGVMIHIHPDDLAASCREIFRVTSQFVLCSEYYSADPRELKYRGHSGQLFLRDYGAFWQQTCPSLVLVDYGFFWSGAGAVDNLTWWLFRKS
jgi:pseudaminic acid biosynthesis-associated methylase